MNVSAFRAYRIHNDDAGYRAGFESMHTNDLSPGEVLVKVAYSSVNYKDALAATGTGKILRRPALNGGVDAAGHVVESSDPRFRAGDAVLCAGAGLSETRDGGYAEFVRLQAGSTVHLPHGLSLRESMILGSAGFSAALALYRMHENRQHPGLGPIAVTGATGGVGMVAVSVFAQAGFEVHAITGKPERAEALQHLGAREVLDRHALAFGARPLESTRFGGAVDNAGGALLAQLLACTTTNGNVASIGLVADSRFTATVMPFILRGVSLLGIGSVVVPADVRDEVWRHLGTDWKPRRLDTIGSREVALDKLPGSFDAILAGKAFGRTVVKVASAD
ncbi:MAG: YhdH/YhfP family quinone oxidoreductase [Rhodanobacteraceae bacterium]